MKAQAKANKINFGTRKKNRAVKRYNKHQSVKQYKGQGR